MPTQIPHQPRTFTLGATVRLYHRHETVSAWLYRALEWATSTDAPDGGMAAASVAYLSPVALSADVLAFDDASLKLYGLSGGSAFWVIQPDSDSQGLRLMLHALDRADVPAEQLADLDALAEL